MPTDLKSICDAFKEHVDNCQDCMDHVTVYVTKKRAITGIEVKLVVYPDTNLKLCAKGRELLLGIFD